jgi:multidrug efflux pump subunit AcrA (membrane-fusion protein)
MAQVAVVLDRRESWGVPLPAIQTRDGQSVLFVVEGQTVQQRTVETGYTQDGWIELVPGKGGDVTDAHRVVTMGQYQLDDGTAISVQQGGN